MNVTRWLLAFFLLAAGLVVWLFVASKPTATTIAGKDRDFGVEKVENIRKIFIAQRDGSTTTLTRKGDTWQYNGEWTANPDVMRNLLHAIENIRIKYKPSEAMEKTMINSLATKGIKVEVYGPADKLLKAYYIGGATADERGTYIMMDGSDQPYVGELANWEGNLRYRYNLKGDDWRDKAVFEVHMDDIKSVSVAYPLQRNESFRLQREGSGFVVEPYFPPGKPSSVAVPRGKVEAYLLGFSFLGAEAFENGNPVRDSIRNLVPFSTVEVVKKDGSKKEVRFFQVRNPGATMLETGQRVRRYFADVDSGDFMLVQDRVFRQIFRGYEFFLPEPS